MKEPRNIVGSKTYIDYSDNAYSSQEDDVTQTNPFKHSSFASLY